MENGTVRGNWRKLAEGGGKEEKGRSGRGKGGKRTEEKANGRKERRGKGKRRCELQEKGRDGKGVEDRGRIENEGRGMEGRGMEPETQDCVGEL